MTGSHSLTPQLVLFVHILCGKTGNKEVTGTLKYLDLLHILIHFFQNNIHVLAIL
jgi:hypothetical protein